MLLAPLAAVHGQEPPKQEGNAPEFLDFLEYLGSWDGDEQDWVQFLDDEESDLTPDAAGEPPPEQEDDDDVVS